MLRKDPLLLKLFPYLLRPSIPKGRGSSEITYEVVGAGKKEKWVGIS